MTTTQAVVRDARELIELIVACAPVDWNNRQMRIALDAILARAIGRGLVWGTDWISCWPQSDGEWIGILAEGEAMYGPEGIVLRRAVAGENREVPAERLDDELYRAAWERLDQYTAVDDCDQLVDAVRNALADIRNDTSKLGSGTLSVALFAYDLGYDRAGNEVI